MFGMAIAAAALVFQSETAKSLDLGSRVDQVVQPYEAAGMFNGAVLVTNGAGEPFFRSYGLANYELGVPIARSTRFQIASITKSFTDAALAKLIDQGKMSLDSKVSDFLPSFPRGSEITVRHILEQRSGLPHTNLLPEYDRSRMTLAESIRILSSKPLDFDPGTDSAYSNGAYDVLAAMIEQAAAVPFQEFVGSAVLKPLGLRNTGFVATYAAIDGMADGYRPGPTPGSRARARFYPVEVRPGGGSMYSTVDDLLTFFRAATAGTLTGPENTALLFGEKGKTYQVTGRNPGYSAVLFTDAANDTYVVTLANNGASLDNFGRRLYRSIRGEPLEVEDIQFDHRKLTAERAAYFNGSYKWEGRTNQPFRIEVSPAGNLVVINPENDYESAMLPLSGGRWLQANHDAVCRPEGTARADAFTCVSPIKERQNNPFRIVRAE